MYCFGVFRWNSARYEGAEYRSSISVPVGEGTLGRIMDVLGRPIDEAGPVKSDELRPIHAPRAEVCGIISFG